MNRLEQVKQMLEESPDDPFLIYAMAMEHLETAPDQALPYLEQLYREHPDYVGTYYQLARLYVAYERLEEAQKVYQQGLKVLKKSAESKLTRELEMAYEEFLFEYEDEL